MVSISPPKREREKEREIASNRCAETREHEEHFPSSVRDGAVEKNEKTARSSRPSLWGNRIPREKERERERESPRNVRPRPRTLTVLYVNRSSFRSFKMLPKPMLATSKTPSLRSHAHESNWCPSKGAQKVKERGGVLRKRNDGVQFFYTFERRKKNNNKKNTYYILRAGTRNGTFD